MAADVTDARATGMMKEVEDDLNRIIKVTLSVLHWWKWFWMPFWNWVIFLVKIYLPDSLFPENVQLFRVEFLDYCLWFLDGDSWTGILVKIMMYEDVQYFPLIKKSMLSHHSKEGLITCWSMKKNQNGEKLLDRSWMGKALYPWLGKPCLSCLLKSELKW